MADEASGDKGFEKFINDNTGVPSNNLPMIIKGLREKMNFITGMFKTTIDSYKTIPEGDQLKAILLAYIIKLTENSEGCLDQCDYILQAYEDAD